MARRGISCCRRQYFMPTNGRYFIPSGGRFHLAKGEISPSRREVLRLLGAEENYENMYLPGDI